MNKKMKICSCGKKVPFSGECECNQKEQRNKYQRDYYRKNKESLKMLSSKRWKNLRKLIISRDGGCCQRCLIKYGIIEDKNLQVHHIKPRIEYPELMYEKSNLICLCKTCNLQLGTSGELDFEPKNNLEKEITFNL